MRTLSEHKVNPVNDEITVRVCDEPGKTGASHAYHLSGPDLKANPSAHHAGPGLEFGTSLLFQQGPPGEVGVNGVTHEALIAVVIDRLRGFQSGPFACRENALALTKLEEAMHWLNARTAQRAARGVEGTHQA